MWNRVLNGCAGLAGLIIAIVVILVSYDVIARNVGLPSPSWVVDLTEYALPLATLLVAPWLANRGEHIKIDLVAMVLPKRTMARLDRVIGLACGAVSALMAWYGANVGLESYQTGALVIKNVIFPEWWVFAPLPVCFSILAFEFVRRALASTETEGPVAE
jgi:TRAP-type C4-dicarboxylate transport system permease small subunit